MNEANKSPIFKESLVDQVYQYLLDKILTNELTYGDNLNIKDISEQLGISTMPVREAIKHLEYDNLVVIKPRSSCQIRIPEQKEIKEYYELREILEIHSIEKFLLNFDSDKLNQLRKIIMDMEKASNLKNTESRTLKLIKLDYDFHTAICLLSGNQQLSDYHKQISIHLNMTIIHKKTYNMLAEKHLESHKIILRNLEKNSDMAVSYLKEHFDNVWDILEK